MTESEWMVETRAAEETEALGRSVAALLPRGAAVALYGELATGKTCFVRGMATRVAGADAVHSPTFTLINEYGDDPRLYHMDLYRLEGPADVEDLGCAEVFASGDLYAIEWADRARGLLPARRLDVHFEHVGEDRRRLTFRDHGVMPEGWRSALERALNEPRSP